MSHPPFMMFAMARPTLLWILFSLFAIRVLGQLLVAAGLAPLLPPMDAWQSGLLPYPLLLASQVVILGAFAVVCFQFSRGEGTSSVHESGSPRRCGISANSAVKSFSAIAESERR